MLALARQRSVAGVCGDLESLPFAADSVDLAWSSLALQWCEPLPAFAELYRVLAPGGAIAFSTLAPGTLPEIDHAFAGIDHHRRVLPFVPLGQLENALQTAGFDHIRLREEVWVTRHTDLSALLATIRGIGANQIGGERRRGLLGKAAWKTAQARFDALRDDNGLLPTTYRVIFGGAVKS